MADVVTVDARGYSCPQPVIMTMNAMKASPSAEIDVLVNEAAPKENVSRLAYKNGYTVSVTEQDGDFVLRLKK